MDLKELQYVNPATHWYYQTKKIPLFKFFERKTHLSGKNLNIIDVGAGSGFFSEELYTHYKNKIGKISLVDTGYSEDEINLAKGEVLKKQRELPNPIEDSLVVLMDILEHLEDDLAMLRAVKNNARGENNFFITVPAFMSLWSPHDDFLGHYRRYTLKSLEVVLNKAGFKTEKIYYIYPTIFPLVWTIRKFFRNKKSRSDMKPVNPIANQLLKVFCGYEMNIRKANKMWGVSCVAEGQI